MSIKARIVEMLPANKVIAVDEQESSYTAIIKGTLKNKRVYVGDFCYLSFKSGEYIVDKIEDRKNFVIRPPVANIDYMLLCISIDMPKPDYILLDKQIILCKTKNIEPIICITKMDLLNKECKEDYNYIKNVYSKIGIKILEISSYNDCEILDKMNIEKGKVYSLSGNSGVGKSTLISKLTNDNTIETGEISSNIKRGKHTTKYVKLYNLNGAYIVDTPGFSSYDLPNIPKKEIYQYFDEIKDIKCEYLDCSHVSEKDCKVKKYVNDGKIDKGRYDRFVYLYNILKENEDNKYKR